MLYAGVFFPYCFFCFEKRGTGIFRSSSFPRDVQYRREAVLLLLSFSELPEGESAVPLATVTPSPPAGASQPG
jgi:hypothetical protein